MEHEEKKNNVGRDFCSIYPFLFQVLWSLKEIEIFLIFFGCLG